MKDEKNGYGLWLALLLVLAAGGWALTEIMGSFNDAESNVSNRIRETRLIEGVEANLRQRLEARLGDRVVALKVSLEEELAEVRFQAEEYAADSYERIKALEVMKEVFQECFRDRSVKNVKVMSARNYQDAYGDRGVKTWMSAGLEAKEAAKVKWENLDDLGLVKLLKAKGAFGERK